MSTIDSIVRVNTYKYTMNIFLGQFAFAGGVILRQGSSKNA